MRIRSFGHLLFALGLAGIGMLSLFSGDFPYSWEPLPTWVPLRSTLAHLSGILLLACCLGLSIKRAAAASSFVLGVFLLGWVLVLQVPLAARSPFNIGMFGGIAESSVLFIGAWALFASLTATKVDWIGSIAGHSALRIARLAFALACVALGLAHFAYARFTADMIPAWIPWHLFFAYFTGVAHIAAGLGVLCDVVPRLAATSEAIMITLFVLVLHIPAAITQPGSRLNWTMVFIATALAGGMWNVADSLRSTPWGWTRWTVQRPHLIIVPPPERI
jgi:uncharacterized membrane protein